MKKLLLIIAILILSLCAQCYGANSQVLLVTDSQTPLFGQLPSVIGIYAPYDVLLNASLPADDKNDLDRYKLIVLSGSLDAFLPHRDRLMDYVWHGGKLVALFYGDAEHNFFPYKLVPRGLIPTSINFPADDPLVDGLESASIKNPGRGDIVKEWNKSRWKVLAKSPKGPVMLNANYGIGSILVVGCRDIIVRPDTGASFAGNILTWAGIDRTPQPSLGKLSVREVLLTVAKRQLREVKDGEWKRTSEEESLNSKPPSGVQWDYPWGVTLYGLLRTSEVTGDKQFADYVIKHNEAIAKHYDFIQWQQQTFGKTGNRAGIPLFDNLDNTGSMASQIVEGLMKHKGTETPEIKKLLVDLSTYIHQEQMRLSDGSFCRPATTKNGQIIVWIDDLYMSCPFLARYGTYSGDKEYWDDAAKQLLNYAGRLQDKDGLWFHGWFEGEQKTSPYKWGRANGWAVLTQVEVLSQLPENHPDRPKLLENFRKHIEGLKQVQAPDGMWRQVLDQPDFWEETSCTGMFTYGIARAVNRGWIGRENLAVAQKAFDALKLRVVQDGSVIDTCVGTGISVKLESYRTRPRAINDHHGIGPLLLAGSELLAAGCK